jgi:hypothetical protein
MTYHHLTNNTIEKKHWIVWLTNYEEKEFGFLKFFKPIFKFVLNKLIN